MFIKTEVYTYNQVWSETSTEPTLLFINPRAIAMIGSIEEIAHFPKRFKDIIHSYIYDGVGNQYYSSLTPEKLVEFFEDSM